MSCIPMKYRTLKYSDSVLFIMVTPSTINQSQHIPFLAEFELFSKSFDQMVFMNSKECKNETEAPNRMY